MSEKNNGGSAFPCAETQYSNSVPGMTLRDYFAGEALSSYLGNDILRDATAKMADHNITTVQAAIAQSAYNIADAMLAERDREE